VDRDWKVTSLVGVVGPYAGVKWLGANEDNRSMGLPRSSSIIAINDRQTGKVLCVMDGTLISALRTGAYAALATEVLGPSEATCVGFLGAGVISRCSLLCMAATVRERIERVLVYSRTLKSRQRFARLMAERTGITVEPVDSAADMVRPSGITVSATTAMDPMIRFSDVRPGSLHIHMGGWEDEKAYVVECSKSPNKIVCDDTELVIHRNAQTAAYAYHDGLIALHDFYGDLGDILLGEKPGREGGELIYFNPVGLPVLDVTVASRLFEKALQENMGVLLGSQTPHWILTGEPASGQWQD
jgi:ornithine cyclodeaminase